MGHPADGNINKSSSCSPIVLVVVVVLDFVSRGNEREDDDETSELVRQHFSRFYSHVNSQFRGVCQAVVWA